MPVCLVQAVVIQKEWEATSVGYMRHDEKIYDCPVYLTTFRGPTYVFLATLKIHSKDTYAKWVQAATACIFQTDD